MKKLLISLSLLIFTLSSIAQHITIKPEIIGGQYNYKMILDQEFVYPESAIKDGAEGQIIVGFVVGEDGIAKDFDIIQSVHPDLDENYIDVLKYLIWIPGNIDGAITEVKMQKSEKFKIKKYQKLVKKRGYTQPPFTFEPYSDIYKIASNKKLQSKAKPSYKGKEVNIYKFIQEYIKVPDAAVKQGIKGVVEISFIIEASGRISNFNEIKGLGGGCTEEAYRLIQLLDWEPAKANGEYVRSSYELKVNFGTAGY